MNKCHLKMIAALMLSFIIIIGSAAQPVFAIADFGRFSAETGDLAEKGGADIIRESRKAPDVAFSGKNKIFSAETMDEPLDFSSMRLIAAADNESVFPEDTPIVSSYKGVYLIQYDTEEDAREGYRVLSEKADFVEVDMPMGVADGEADTDEDSKADREATLKDEGSAEKTDAFSELEAAIERTSAGERKSYDIALIDTGSFAEASGFCLDAVSMLGDDGADRNGHGTQMLNTVFNYYPGAAVLSVKALGDDGRGDTSSVYAAMQYAMSQDVKIINLSLSSRASQENSIIETAIDEAVEKGITVVAAAGNNANNAKWYIPGSVESAVVVGAMDAGGCRQSFSNYGETVDYYVQESSTSAAAALFSAFLAAGKDPEEHIRENDEALYVGLIRRIAAGGDGSVPPDGSGMFSAAAVSVTDWLGVSRNQLVQWLSMHENDDYYLNTPYNYKTGNYDVSAADGSSVSVSIPENPYYRYGSGLSVPWSFYTPYGNGLAYEDLSMVPNGASSGVPQLNCGGFVAHALLNSKNMGGMDDNAYSRWQERLENVGQAQAKPRSAVSVNVNSALGLCGAFSFKAAAAAAGVQPDRTYTSVDGRAATAVENMLADGFLKKGDIVIFENTAQLYARDTYGNFNDWHIGVFWGDSPSENVFWHSTHESEGVQSESNPAYLKGSLIKGTLNSIVDGSGAWNVEQTALQNGAVLGNIISSIKPKSEWGRIYVYRLAEGDTGKACIVKTSSMPEVTGGNAVYSLKGAVFGIYASKEEAEAATDSNRGTPVAVLTTAEDGRTPQAELTVGVYYIKELTAPAGFIKDDTVKAVRVVTGQVTETVFSDRPALGTLGLLLRKTDKQNGAAQGAARLENAQYTVEYFNNTDMSGTPLKTWVFRTDANGEIRFRADHKVSGDDLYISASGEALMPPGSLRIKETAAPEGYKLDDTVYKVYLVQAPDGKVHAYKDPSGGERYSTDAANAAEDLSIVSQEQIKAGSLSVQKIDALTGKAPASDASGIEFRVSYADDPRNADCVIVNGAVIEKGQTAAVIITDGKGFAATPDDLLPYGYYLVEETDVPASTGLLASGFSALVFVDGNDTEASPIPVENDHILGGINFQKVDSESGTALPQGMASLEGAEITVYNDSGFDVFVNGEMKADGEAVAVLKTDGEGRCGLGAAALPYGIYHAQETAASFGYLLNEQWRVDFQIREDGTVIDASSDEYKVSAAEEKSGWISSSSKNAALTEENIKRADLRFKKVDIDGSPMAGIPFMISRLDDYGNVVEEHVIVSGPDGTVDTSERSKTGRNVNSLDSRVQDGRFTGGEASDADAGVWFGEESAMSEDRGALIFAAYRITELPCDANTGQQMLSSGLFVDSEGVFTAEFEDGKVYDLENIFIDLIVHPESDLLDDASDTKVIARGKRVSITDAVRFDHLKTDRSYRLVAEIYHEDREGNIKKIGEGETVFNPEASDTSNTAGGTAKVTAVIDTTEINGGKVHAVDSIYVIDGESEAFLVSHNKDMDDERQMLRVPYISTKAKDEASGLNIAAAYGTASLRDTVEYEGLSDGASYIIEERLVYSDGSGIVKDLDGNECRAAKQLTVSDRLSAAEDRNGQFAAPSACSIEMPSFIVNAKALEGKTVVFTETLYDLITQEVMVEHSDLSDEGQSIHFPKISTEAKDGQTGLHEGQPSGEVTITDRVEYENLLPGKVYTFTGRIYDARTGAPYLDDNGREVSAALEKTVNSPDGYVELVFTFSGENLNERTVVVFEDVSVLGRTVAVHHDLDDESQSVHYKEPSKPEKPEAPNPPETVPRTGDGESMLMYGAFIFGALIAILALLYIRKRSGQ